MDNHKNHSFSISSLETSQGRIWVEQYGNDQKSEDRPSLLLIHGFAGSTRWWDQLVQHLCHTYHIVAVDMLGHGKSSNGYYGYSIIQQSSAFIEILKDLNVERLVIVGHSLGTHVALAVSEMIQSFQLHIEVDGLVILDQCPTFDLATFPRFHTLIETRIIGKNIRRLSPDFLTRRTLDIAFASHSSWGSFFHDPHQPLHDLKRISHTCYREMQKELPLFTQQHSLESRIRSTEVPTLVVFGEHDRLNDVPRSCLSFNQVANTTVAVIRDAGHSPMVERPLLLSQELYPFLRSLGNAPTTHS